VLHGDLLVVVAHRGELLLRTLVRDEEGRWFLAPMRPGEQAIPVEIDDVHESPPFGVPVHGILEVGPSAFRGRNAPRRARKSRFREWTIE
jgi:hypothetical protein